jgi:predicted transposase YbfD/YdcC
VALDGKSLRGTRGKADSKQSAVHLLALYEVKTGLVLAQEQIPDKQNEISAAALLLTPLLLKDRIVSADAMHTQRNHCRFITEQGGDYILVAKNNQPQLYEDLQLFFEDKEADRTQWPNESYCEKKHGRLTRWHITCSTDLNSYFGREWAGVAQVFRLELRLTHFCRIAKGLD